MSPLRSFSSFLVCVFALGAFVISPGLSASAESLSVEIVKAEALIQEGKDSDALPILNRYLQAHPSDARALVDRGDAYEDENKQEDAIADYTSAIGVNPEYAYAYASRCQSEYEVNRMRGALGDCDKAIQLAPKDAYAYRERALVHEQMDDLEAAQADADRAVQYDPDSDYGFAVRCRVRYYAKRYADAQADCAKALQMNGKSYMGLFYTGRLQIHAEAWPAADATFSKVLDEEQGDDPDANYWRAVARLNEQKPSQALDDINVYIAHNADDAEAHLLRAEIQQQLHDLSAARADATDALRHFRIDNDEDGAARAQRLLDALSGSPTP